MKTKLRVFVFDEEHDCIGELINAETIGEGEFCMPSKVEFKAVLFNYDA